MSLEHVRQQCVAFAKAEAIWKANPPKGKEYVGFRFKQYGTYPASGIEFRPVPIFKKIARTRRGGR